jgi:hypothetical protein
MTSRHQSDAGLDELLKSALADDLPPDVAAGMRERAARFRERMARREEGAAFRAPMFRKTAWAALSLLFLVSGGLLQGRGSRSPLADGISLLKTRLAVSGRLADAESMSCSVRIRRPDGASIDYEIAWRAGRPAEVRAEGPEGPAPGGPPEMPEALASTVAWLSTPSSVGKRLSGGWRFIRTSWEAGCDVGAYAIPAGPGSEALEFTIDLCAYLPVRIAGTSGTGFFPGSPDGFSWEATFKY